MRSHYIVLQLFSMTGLFQKIKFKIKTFLNVRKLIINSMLNCKINATNLQLLYDWINPISENQRAPLLFENKPKYENEKTKHPLIQ